MRCAYREVMAQEKRLNAYREITDDFLQFLDASAGCVLHDTFGHGQNRLFDMYSGLHESVNDAMEETDLTESDIGPDAPENVREILARIRNKPKSEAQLAEEAVEEYKGKLLDCGFDMDAVAADVPEKDGFTRHGIASCESNHAVRTAFLRDIWLIVQMYHGALLSWMRKRHGFGAIRLERTYRLLVEDYREYCGQYLRCTAQGDRAAVTMTEKRQKRCRGFGIMFEE